MYVDMIFEYIVRMPCGFLVLNLDASMTESLLTALAVFEVQVLKRRSSVSHPFMNTL
jgi:hypothetical protein